MSKSFQDKYYEILVTSTNGVEEHKYVTKLPIVKGQTVNRTFVEFMKKVHGDNILIVYNEKNGKMPGNIDEVDVWLPQEPELNYNR